MAIFYTPDRAWLGDVIPYAEDGKFYLYYLNDKRYGGRVGKETTWDLITTTDFVNFEEAGTALPTGARNEMDNSVYTGSVLKDQQGNYHIFYTAQNSEDERFFDENGNPIQTVVHATSDDLVHWEKHLDQMFRSDGKEYTMNDWRDPFVYWDEEKGKYGMLLAAVKKNAGYRRGGCTLRAYSEDLLHWEVGDLLYAPDAYLTHECPDLFKLNDKWYLAFSTFTDKFLTHYRMSDSIDGPWVAPLEDSWDARAYYAAKTAEANGIRYAFGWIPTKKNNNDYECYEWGGTLVVHQIVPQKDGTLFVKMPDTLYASFKKTEEPLLWKLDGDVCQEGQEIQIDGTYRPGYAVFKDLPAECMIECEMEFSENIRTFGLALHQNDNLDEGYWYKIEPVYQRLVMDMWPRRQLPQEQVNLGGDITMQCELERLLRLNGSNKVRWKAVIDRDCVVIYINDQVAMSTRIYNLMGNPRWGFFAMDGKVTVRDIKVKTR